MNDYIKIDNLKFHYPKQALFKNLSLSIKKGAWVAIIGPNGSGKSTLAKLLVGLLPAHSGKILIDGIELKEETLVDLRKKIGIVFQNPDNQFVGVTVKHDIAFGMENYQIPRENMLLKITEVLDSVNMSEYINTEPSTLSGGEKQRIAIAGCLAVNQDIIIFDEATSMLDPKGTKEVIALIQSLNKESQKTVITITHDLEFANLSDEIIVLNKGEIIDQGKPSEVYKNIVKLREIGLDVPTCLGLLSDILENEKLKTQNDLLEVLWELSSKR